MWLVLTHCRILNNLFPLLYVCDVSYKVGSTTMRRLYHIFYTKSEKTMMKRVHEIAESHAKLIKSEFDVSLAYSSHCSKVSNQLFSEYCEFALNWCHLILQVSISDHTWNYVTTYHQMIVVLSTSVGLWLNTHAIITTILRSVNNGSFYLFISI